MRNAWAMTLDQVLHSSSFPMWITLAAAAVFALILFVTLIRAEKSVANGALTVITLLAIGIAVAATVRRFDPLERAADEGRAVTHMVSSVPALSCLDGLAGEAVEASCERALFGSADVAAAAVSYTAVQLSRLAPREETGAQTPEQQSLRRTLERDRYGLVAQVLVVREHCSETACDAFGLFADPTQIKTNMRDHVYEAIIGRYATAWSAATSSVAAAAPTTPMQTTAATMTAAPPVATVAPAVRNPIEFPSATSIPPVSIMTEPGTAAATPAAQAAKPVAPAATNAQAAAPTPHPPAAKKQESAAKKPAVANAANAQPKQQRPTSLTPPATAAATTAPKPATTQAADDDNN